MLVLTLVPETFDVFAAYWRGARVGAVLLVLSRDARYAIVAPRVRLSVLCPSLAVAEDLLSRACSDASRWVVGRRACGDGMRPHYPSLGRLEAGWRMRS